MNTSVAVRLGVRDQVEAVPSEAVQLLVDKAQRGQVTTEIKLDPEVTAPVSRGQRLGTMTVRVGEQILSQIPLVASEPVARLTWQDLFVRILRKVAMAKEGA